MKSSDVFPSKWLKAEDLDEDMTVTIKSVTKEAFKDQHGQESMKPCAYFEETDKGLIINKTNWKLLEQATGEDDSDSWAGKKVVLTIVDVDAFGDVVAAIRVKKAALDKNALVARYQKVFERARVAGVEDLDAWAIDPEALSEQEIIDLGKELKAAVEIAEAI